MTDRKSAEVVFKTLCDYLDSKDWKYTKDEGELSVSLTTRGDDLPIAIRMYADPERSLLRLRSAMFYFPEDKRVEGAICTQIANYSIIDGSFKYDITDGELTYSQLIPYRGAIVTEDTIEYLLLCACITVDRFNDKLFLVSQGQLDVKGFIEAIKS